MRYGILLYAMRNHIKKMCKPRKKQEKEKLEKKNDYVH